MPRSLHLPDLDDELLLRLEQRAARHGRSAEAEVQAILQDALQRDPSPDFWTKAAEFRARLAGRSFTPSEVLLRQDRDER